MPEERIPVGAQFLGVQKRVAPHLLQPTHSPDCQNCRPYSGLIGRLGPRKGRTKLSSTAYAARTRGFWPGSGGGGDSGDDYSLVAIDDGTSVTILSESAIWSGGGAWGGPAVTEFNGFYKEQALASGATPGVASSGVLAVPVNGATKAICTMASIIWASTGSLLIYGTFDGGVGRKLLAEMFAEYADTCCSGGDGTLTITHTSTLVDITGAANLTLIDAVSDMADGAETISGSVILMGVKA